MRIARIGLATTLLVTLTAWSIADHKRSSGDLKGDWDYYRMLGAASIGGFGGMRLFGFAHFEGPDTAGAWINRRAGGRMEQIRAMTIKGDSLILDLGNNTIRAVVGRDTIAGRYFNRDGMA